MKAYLHAKTVRKHWQLASVYLNESCNNITHAAWEIFILISRSVETYHTIYDERSIKQPITITMPCDRFEKRILPVHFRMALVLRSEMVSQVIISIFCCSLRKLKWKFPSNAERWWTNQGSMGMRKSSCKNTPQYLKSCCSPIGQNNTKDFYAQSGGSIGRAVWKWSGKSRFPGAFSALVVNLRRFIYLPDLFSLEVIFMKCFIYWTADFEIK